MTKTDQKLDKSICLFDLILYIPINNFSVMLEVGTGLNQYLARINVSCSRTQRNLIETVLLSTHNMCLVDK